MLVALHGVVVPDHACPIAIGLQRAVILLEHELLHLAEHLGVAFHGEVLHGLVHYLYGNVLLLRLHGAVGRYLRHVVAVLRLAHAGLRSTAVGRAGLLANLLEVDHGEHLARDGSLDAALHGVRHR